MPNGQFFRMGPEQSNRSYAGVRALERGLDLLQAIGRLGRATPSELADQTKIDRTTIYRLLNTLRERGYVGHTGPDGRVGLADGVRVLGERFTDLDFARSVVAPRLRHLVEKIKWASDFATFGDGTMVIHETTRRFSPFASHRAIIPQTMAVMQTAVGKAVLAGVNEAERDSMLTSVALADSGEASLAVDQTFVRLVLEDVRKRGYAWSISEPDVGTSAIACPLRLSNGIIGAINISFFTSSLSPEAAARKFLDELTQTAVSIEDALRPQETSA